MDLKGVWQGRHIVGGKTTYPFKAKFEEMISGYVLSLQADESLPSSATPYQATYVNRLEGIIHNKDDFKAKECNDLWQEPTTVLVMEHGVSSPTPSNGDMPVVRLWAECQLEAGTTNWRRHWKFQGEGMQRSLSGNLHCNVMHGNLFSGRFVGTAVSAIHYVHMCLLFLLPFSMRVASVDGTD